MQKTIKPGPGSSELCELRSEATAVACPPQLRFQSTPNPQVSGLPSLDLFLTPVPHLLHWEYSVANQTSPIHLSTYLASPNHLSILSTFKLISQPSARLQSIQPTHRASLCNLNYFQWNPLRFHCLKTQLQSSYNIQLLSNNRLFHSRPTPESQLYSKYLLKICATSQYKKIPSILYSTVRGFSHLTTHFFIPIRDLNPHTYLAIAVI